jgi:hypothetical protein
VKGKRPVRRRATAAVVDLSSVRAQKTRELAERRVRGAMNDNRAAVARLFSTGLIFTQKGSRAARELLLAYQALLRFCEVFARMIEPGSRDDYAFKMRADAAFASLDAQLARTAQLTQRTGDFLSGRRGD